MPEITKTQNQTFANKDRIVWFLLAIVTIAVYFFALDLPLLGPDEPRYAQVAREMFEKKDWVTPTLGGANWFEKPALLYWLQIAAYNVFGVSEFAARFGSALFGLGTILSLWILGRKGSAVRNQQVIGAPATGNRQPATDFADWLALIAASSIGLLAFSRGASFDIILTFPITASLVSFFIFDQAKEKSFNTYHLPLTTFYFFIGVAMLAKGLIGIVFPFAIVAFYFVLSRKLPNKFFIFSLIWGTILSLLVAAAWYLPMYQTHGWTFIDEFFIQHHFQRYTSNKYQHPQPFPFFFWVLPLMTLPWLPFFLASIWKTIKSFFQRENLETRQSAETKSSFLSFSASPLLRFAIAWLLVPLVFFSFSGSKLPGYILPALPAALILTAVYIDEFVSGSRKRQRAIQIVAFVTFAGVAAALQFIVPSYAQADSTKHLIESANANGYSNAKILNLHTTSHNAEFYGAGRLIRNADGKLKKHLGVAEVAEEIKRQNGEAVLVLVSLEYLHELPESPLVESHVLGKSGEIAIVAVKNR